MTTSLKFFQSVKAPISQVYTAFTNATLLREWFCDVATTKPSPGGRFFANWDSDYYVCGDFITLDKDSKISLNWLGKEDPGKTVVTISFSLSENATNVEIDHSGIGTSPEWEKTSIEIAKGWNLALENLKSTLERGEDLRITRRPMIGIIVDKVDENGLSISDVVDGMGAKDAGMKGGDVIKKFDGVEINDYGVFNNQLSQHRSGDEVELEVARQSGINSIKLKLSGRKIPEILWNPPNLAEKIEKRNKDVEERLDNLVKDISDTEASQKPDNDQWNIMEIIAHLIHGQRGLLNLISEIIGMQQGLYDDYGGNQNAAVMATCIVFPTLNEIMAEFKHIHAEVVAYISKISPEFVAHKSSYWRLALILLEEPYHFFIHEEQIKNVIQQIKSGN